MRYILRVVIHENMWERQLKDIIELCKKSNIEEVFVKEQCHQILMSPVSLEKHRRMSKIYVKIAQKLRENGIKFSINIATIVGHCDAELKGEDNLSFTHFVSSSLKESHSNYCIMDDNWLEYAEKEVSLYAESKPEIMMIDDDFRSLNHSGYIGCFCPLHVAAVSRELGINLTKETLLKHVMGSSGEDRKIRAAWMKVNFRAQKRAAARIGEAVRRVSPDTRVGLMNSGEENHSIQGRNMEELLLAFAKDKRPVSRPTGSCYSDSLHEQLVSAVQTMSLSMSVLPKDTEVVSEVENWPHTRYTKSIRETSLQMKLHALAGADAITMNIFDFFGTPYSQEPEFCDMIRDTKDELNLISALRKDKEAVGVGLLWDPRAAEFKKDGLVPDRTQDIMFPLLGINTCFKNSDVNYVNQEIVSSLSDDEIKELLKKGLIIDDTATRELVERGFSSLIGCTIDGDINEVSAEILKDGEFSGIFKDNMVPTDLLRNHLQGHDMPKIKVLDGARVLTEILDKDYNKIGDGITLYENQLGGRVCIIPTQITMWTFAYRSRAYMLRKIVEWLCREENFVSLKDGVDVAPFYYENRKTGEGLLALLNTGLDSEKISVNIKGKAYDMLGNEVTLKNMTLPPLSLIYFKTQR